MAYGNFWRNNHFYGLSPINYQDDENIIELL